MEIGFNNNITAEVKSGLSEGDAVVTAQAAGSGTAATGGAQRNTANRSLLGGAGGPPPF